MNKSNTTTSQATEFFASSIKQAWKAAPGGFCGFMALKLLVSVFPGAILYVNKLLFDKVQLLLYGEGELRAVLLLAAAYAVSSFVLYQVLWPLCRVARSYVTDKSVLCSQRTIHQKLRVIRYEYFETQAVYDSISRVQSSYPDIQAQSAFSVFNIIGDIVAVLSLIAGIAAVDLWIAVPAVLFAIPYISLNKKYNYNNYYKNFSQTPVLRKADYLFQTLFDKTARKEIHFDQSSGLFFSEWEEKQKRIWKESRELRERHLYRKLLYDCVKLLSETLICFYLASGILTGKRLAGSLSSVIYAFSEINFAVVCLANDVSCLSVDCKYYGEYKDFLALEESSIPRADSLDILCKDVTYQYPNGEKEVLRGVSFKIRQGEKIALVGENGCGKTTLIKVLLGFLTPASGVVECSPAGIAAVFQDSFRFQDSIRDNIEFGCLGGKSEERLAEAAKKVGLYDYITSLPKGFETPLGSVFNDSTEFSGGQWQRLAIARALYNQDAKIVILDEPTSALDAKMEFDLYEHFMDLFGGKTVIMISHRLAYTRLMDRILCMKDGVIVEEGGHAELMEKRAGYYELYKKQTELFQ